MALQHHIKFVSSESALRFLYKPQRYHTCLCGQYAVIVHGRAPYDNAHLMDAADISVVAMPISLAVNITGVSSSLGMPLTSLQ